MQISTAPKKPWTKGEKFLLSSIIIAALLAVLGYAGWTQINATPVVSIPTPVLPAQNAFDYFKAAAAAEKDGDKVDWSGTSGPAKMTSEQKYLRKKYPNDHPYSLGEKIGLVQENAQTLQILRQGLAYPYQSPPAHSFFGPSVPLGRFRTLARLVQLESEVQEEQGDWGGAMQSRLDLIQMGEDIPHGSDILGVLAALAIQSLARNHVWLILTHLSAAQAKADARRREAISANHVPYADAVQVEEWDGQTELLAVFRDPHWRGTVQDFITGQDNGMGWNRTQRAEMFFVRKTTIMQNYTRFMDQRVRNARSPYTAQLPPPSTAHLDPLTKVLADADDALGRFLDADAEAQNALLMTALALRAYRIEHGTYPTTLGALTPDCLSRVPDDPFALAGSLRYKRVGAKYVLYSVGPDGKDDGGKPIFDASMPTPKPGERDIRYRAQVSSKGDIVAGVNW